MFFIRCYPLFKKPCVRYEGKYIQIMRDIKFRYQLKLVSDDWGNYKEGDIDTFYFSLNDKQSGLYRFSIDERWEIVSCDEWTGLTCKKDDDIFENDIFKYTKHKGYLYDDFTGQIKFKDGCFGFEVITGQVYADFTPFSEIDELENDFLNHIEIIQE